MNLIQPPCLGPDGTQPRFLSAVRVLWIPPFWTVPCRRRRGPLLTWSHRNSTWKGSAAGTKPHSKHTSNATSPGVPRRLCARKSRQEGNRICKEKEAFVFPEGPECDYVNAALTASRRLHSGVTSPLPCLLVVDQVRGGQLLDS